MLYRALFVALSIVAVISPASALAQPYSDAKPRRQFVTITLDWLNTQPLHFLEHPLQDLVGTDVAAAQFKPYEYETRDGLTRIDVLEFSGRGVVVASPFILWVSASERLSESAAA